MATTRTIEHKLEVKSISKDKQPSWFGIQHFGSGKLSIALFPFLDNKSLAKLSATSKSLTNISTDTLEQRVLNQLILFLKSPDVVGKTYTTQSETSYGSGNDRVVLITWQESNIRFPTNEEIDGILHTCETPNKTLNTLIKLITLPLQFYLIDLKSHLPERNSYVSNFRGADIESIPPSINHLLQTRAIFHRLGNETGERWGIWGGLGRRNRSVTAALLNPVESLLHETFSFHIWNHDYTRDPQPLLKELQTRGLNLEKSLLLQLMSQFRESIPRYTEHTFEKLFNASFTKLENALTFLVKQGMPIEPPEIWRFTSPAIHTMLISTYQFFYNEYSKSFKIRLINLALKLGANINAVDDEGDTVFLDLAERDETTALLMLKLHRKSIDLNAINNKGKTAVMLAAERGHEALLKELIDGGADVTLNHFHTASSLAERSYSKPVLQLLAAAMPISFTKEDDGWEMVTCKRR